MKPTKSITGTALYFYKNEVIKKYQAESVKESDIQLNRRKRRILERSLTKNLQKML